MWNDLDVGIILPYDGEPLLFENDKVQKSLRESKVEF